MAILENRVKDYNTKKSKQISIAFSPAINITNIIIIAIITLATRQKLLGIDQLLLEITGKTVEKIVNPVKIYLESAFRLTINLSNIKALELENLSLKAQNKNLKSAIHKNKTRITEFENLKSSISLVSHDYNIITRSSIILMPTSESSEIIISGGIKNGIKENNIVISNGYLIGRIVTVSQNFSKFLPLTSYKSRIPVKTNNSKLNAIMAGDTKNSLNLVHLHGRQKPRDGEDILTSGEGNYFPANIPVGTIKIINGNPTVKLYTHISTTDYVEVVNNEIFE
jgi:rod shape-determining protein MreC